MKARADRDARRRRSHRSRGGDDVQAATAAHPSRKGSGWTLSPVVYTLREHTDVGDAPVTRKIVIVAVAASAPADVYENKQGLIRTNQHAAPGWNITAVAAAMRARAHVFVSTETRRSYATHPV